MHSHLALRTKRKRKKKAKNNRRMNSRHRLKVEFCPLAI